MKFLAFCFLIFFHFAASATTSFIEIVKLKGHVSKLFSGVREAKGLSYDDKFEEDTSLLSGAKSSVKLRFGKNTELTLGPNSKIILSEFKNNNFFIINLLKGRVRIIQNKDSNSQALNFFIKTRTALIGSTEADYQVIYNSENKITSVLTFKGEVVLSKNIDRLQGHFSLSKTEVIRDDDSKIPTLINSQYPSNNYLTFTSQLNNSNFSQKVKAGQSSIINDSFQIPSIPVKISLNQLQVLFQNFDLDEKNNSDLKPFMKLSLPKYDVVQADQSAPLEGYKNEKLGEYAPRSGGLIDLESGVYIAPGRDAFLDEQNKIYNSDMMGRFDEKTGQYIPPNGVRLNPLKGFTVIENNSPPQPETVALTEDLNSMIAKDILLTSKFSENSQFEIDKKYLRNNLKFSLHNYLIVNELNTHLSNEIKLNSKNSFGFSFIWQMASLSRFSPLIGLGYSKVDYKQPSSATINLPSKKLLDLTFGSYYSLDEFTDAFGLFKLAQDNYVDQSNLNSPSALSFQKVVVAKIISGLERNFMIKRNWSLYAQMAAVFNFRKKINKFVIDKGYGYQFNILPRYSFSPHKWIELGIFHENSIQKIRNGIIENRSSKTTNDLSLTYIVDY